MELTPEAKPAADNRAVAVERLAKKADAGGLQPEDPDKMVHELAASSRLVYKKCLSAELRPVKIDSRIYIPLTEIERYETRR